jgi:hypothetical protein
MIMFFVLSVLCVPLKSSESSPSRLFSTMSESSIRARKRTMAGEEEELQRSNEANAG